MRYLLLLLLGACIASCQPSTETETPQDLVPLVIKDPGVEVDSNAIVLVPLTNTGVRFDGVYHYAKGNLRYYMRFFERGNAAFVGGTEKYTGQLAEMLTIDVRSGWNQIHNCPVRQANDSLFIRSMGIKGAINYLGEVRAQGDSVRFLKASEITGSRELASYVFLPDSRLQEEKAKFLQTQ